MQPGLTPTQNELQHTARHRYYPARRQANTPRNGTDRLGLGHGSRIVWKLWMAELFDTDDANPLPAHGGTDSFTEQRLDRSQLEPAHLTDPANPLSPRWL